jgi:hypothetical protein
MRVIWRPEAMAEDRVKRPAGSDSHAILLGVVGSLAATALWALLAAAFAVFTKPVTLPIWAFLTIMTALFLGAAWVVYFTRQQLQSEIREYEETIDQWQEAEQRWQDRASEQDEGHAAELEQWAAAQKSWLGKVKQLEDKLEDEEALVFEKGLYYRRTDEKREQPFCRICQDRDGKQVTVSLWHNNGGKLMFTCPRCEQAYDAQILPDEGEEISF